MSLALQSYGLFDVIPDNNGTYYVQEHGKPPPGPGTAFTALTQEEALTYAAELDQQWHLHLAAK